MPGSALAATSPRCIIHPTNPDIAYILRSGTGIQSGVWKTTDGGATDWVQKTTGLGSTAMSWGFLNPSAPLEMWVACGAGVYASTDGGENWVARNTGLADPTKVRVVVAHPQFPTRNEFYVGTTDGNVYKSTDRGANWSLLGTVPNPNIIRFIAIDPTNDQIFYAAGSGFNNFWKSTDGGVTWALKNTGITGINSHIGHVIIDPANPNILYIPSYNNGVHKSTDKGESWTAISKGMGTAIGAMVADPSDPEVLYAASGSMGNGAWKSTDKGANWFRINSGFPSTNPHPGLIAMVMDPADTGVLYTGAGSAFGVYGTTDAGASWTALANQPGNKNISKLAIGTGRLYALTTGTGPGLYMTADAGATAWTTTTLLSPAEARCLAVDPATPATVYVGRSNSGTVRKSTDAGVTWTSADIPGDSAVLSIAVAEANPAILFAGTSKAKVYRSTDGGSTWQERSSGLPTLYDWGAGVIALAIDPLQPEIAYAGLANEGGIYRTTDGGLNWTNMSADFGGYPSINALVLDQTDRTTLYAGTSQHGVWVCAAPAAPVLVSPASGAPNVPISGNLDWNPSARATAYEVYLKEGAAPGPGDKVGEVSEPTTEFAYDGHVTNGKTYYWKIAAKNVGGATSSEVRSFTTIVAAPAAPVLVSPANGAQNVPTAGNLDWGTAARATAYEVYLKEGAEPGPGDKVGEVAEPTTEFAYATHVANNKTYYWKVVAKNVGGTASSEAWCFTTLPAGWREVRSVPEAPSGKPVKDGAWLAIGPDREIDGQVIYAAKGNKTTDFFKYVPAEGVLGTWHELAPIPLTEGGRDKAPKKGCRGVSDGVNFVYMTKGNNTLGFWRYSISANDWGTPLPDVPLGTDNKKVKGGEDMVYVPAQGDDPGCVYLLKGFRTEFYRFNTAVGADTWEKLDDVPFGGTKKKYDQGSFLVYDPAGYIYAHQAKYTDGVSHYMFKFDLTAQKWTDTLEGMPVLGVEGGREKKKKSKDGAAGAWYDGCIYALKGGNTEQFWKYTPGAEPTWTQLDPVPLFAEPTEPKKRMKAGSDLVGWGANVFFALKGNKTLDLWRFVIPTEPASRPARNGVMAEALEVHSPSCDVSPSPLTGGFATIRYSLPKAGAVGISVYDIAGHLVEGRVVVAAGRGALSLDVRELPAGAYLVRLDADGYSATHKLVVQK